ncbi:fish-egg lectin-like [Megalops cyprinoides]|uniref:fish-egg lectin-like n=1 Tax=Megalops cyprinoides TaxID=118141 RepID=UPI00186447BD|nr:fish-egg lectin-like [Megalops cyprinoides]
MRMPLIFLLLQYSLTQTLALQCTQVPGKLKQIDAGVGQVFGVNDGGNIYTLYGRSWVQLPGLLKHVSVGPAGIWGTNNGNNIYKMVGGDWVQVPGLLKQVDAGGDQIISGVNMDDAIFCMGRQGAVQFKGPSSPTPWQGIPGGLKYYTCGPKSCWGVNSNDDIYIMKDVTDTNCMGNKSWQNIPGKLSMIEVATDGSVYGVNKDGDIYRRDGITDSAPAGTAWTAVSVCMKSKHVSFDLGHLWVITQDGSILDCV